MFLTWSIADAWGWLVNLPFLGGILLISPALAIMAVNLANERR